jgi:Ni/Fe-hydrogenase 1 B-type cytochrome subunit
MKTVYVWEFPVRLAHWALAACIVVLSITGFYIGAPFIHAVENSELIMSGFRFAHFTAAFIFCTAVFIRIYWMFAGNKYASYDQFIPISPERRRNVVDTGLFYAFFTDRLNCSTGHTALAGVTYTFLFCLYLTEIVTGSAMLYIAHGGGAMFWTMGGWSLAVMGVGYLRLIHHMVMWGILVFVLVHVYIGWHNDMIEKNGMISSIFSGYKNMECED